MSEHPPRRRLGLGYRQRLHGRRQFDAVFAARCRKPAGPLTILTRPNGLAFSRLGLAVPRRVGTAVRRNRIKRLLREAFRLRQRELPAGYDVVVLVRPHEPIALQEYQKLLESGLRAADRQWQRWSSKTAKQPPESPREDRRGPGNSPRGTQQT